MLKQACELLKEGNISALEADTLETLLQKNEGKLVALKATKKLRKAEA